MRKNLYTLWTGFILFFIAVNILATQDSQLPKQKQTVLGLYVTSEQAYQKWQKDPNRITILDVRSPEEYVLVGHPAMAYNIPVMLLKENWYLNPGSGMMQANIQFVDQVKAKFNVSDKILVICRSGGRSARAVNLLAKSGFKNVYSITDGFEGDKNKDKKSPDYGKRTVNGWKNAQIPWTYTVDPKYRYSPQLR